MPDHPAVERCKRVCQVQPLTSDVNAAIDALAAALTADTAALRERHRRLVDAVQEMRAAYDACYAAGDAAPAATTPAPAPAPLPAEVQDLCDAAIFGSRAWRR